MVYLLNSSYAGVAGVSRVELANQWILWTINFCLSTVSLLTLEWFFTTPPLTGLEM